MQKVKATLGSFADTVWSTFGCANADSHVINDEEDRFTADTDKDGGSSGSGRSTFVEIDLLRTDLNRQRKFPGNSVRTAKYTLLTGLPLSLLYQFYKVSNAYFLLVMVITLVPGASPINPFSSIVPLCIVLGAGILKDLWEDRKRRMADKRANEMLVYVLRAGTGASSKGLRHRKKGATAAASTSSCSGTPIETQNFASDSDGCAAESSRAKGTTEDSLAAVAVKEGEAHGVHDQQQNLPSRRQRVVRVLSPASSLSGDTKIGCSDKPHGGEGAHAQDEVEMTSRGENCASSAAAPMASSLRHTAAPSQEPATPAAVAEPVVSFQPVRSCDVYPGDVMLFRLGEEVKADCLLLSTSLPDGLTYIETANLDGETNAKTRRAKIQTVEALGTVEDIVEKALGVPASDAAAVHARMNGLDIEPQSALSMSGEAAAQGEVRRDCCHAFGGVGAGSATDRGAGASKEGAPAHSKTAAPDGDDMIFTTAIPESSARPGDFSNPLPSHQHGLLTPACPSFKGREATEHDEAAAAADGEAPHPYIHQRGLSYPHQPFPRLASSSTTGISLARTAADFSAAVSSASYSGATPATPGIPPEHRRHRRFMTLNERLAEEGQLPMPPQLRQLSERYERAVHSRTNSASVYALSLSRVHALQESYSNVRPHGVTSRAGESESVPVDAAGSASGLNSCGRSSALCMRDRSVMADEEPTGDNSRNYASDAAPGGLPASGVVLVACAPTPDLSTWFGQLRLPTGEMVPLGIDQFIPRGCLIRNTDWALGAVVYTGRHTKMLLNLQPKPHKMTNMARRLNHMNVCFFVLNQLFILLLCGLAVWSKQRLLRKVPGAKTNHSAWYIQWQLERYSDASLFWWRYLTNFVLLSYLIPMSLYVTLEFNKAMQMLLIGVDKRMAVFDEFTGVIKKARPKTSELNCQLGLVRYIFTDKTGTLTENLMTYVGGVVDGRTHSEIEQPGGVGRALLRRITAHTATGFGANALASNVDSAGKVPPLRLHQHHHRLLSSTLSREASALDDGATTRFLVAMQKFNALATKTAASSSGAGGDKDYPLTYPLPHAEVATVSHRDAASSGGAVTPHQDTQGATSGDLTSALDNGDGTHPGTEDGGAGAVLPPAAQEAHEHPALAGSAGPLADDALSSNGGGGPRRPPHTEAAALPSQLGPTRGVTLSSQLQRSTSCQWGSGTFGGATFSCFGSGVSGPVGLGKVSEDALERDPLFRYLRALALCHSVVCFPVDEAVHGTAEAQRAAESGEGAPRGKKRHNPSAVAGKDGAAHKQKGDPRHDRHRTHAEECQGKDTSKKRRGRACTVDPARLSTHHRHSREAAHHAPQPAPLPTILPLTDISGGNFVEIPYAVPSGPEACEDFELYATVGANGSRRILSAHDLGNCSRAAPLTTTAVNMLGSSQRQRSHRPEGDPKATTGAAAVVDLGLTAKSTFKRSTSSFAMLHGRTSSTSWYQNRYLNRAMHSRNVSALASHDGGECSRTGGFERRAAASSARGGSAAAEATASIEVSDLEQFIDRSKIYEGQSLDEIALVNAARENGFSLFERTAKQMYVKALGRILCYDIVAELEFTPQRKLMSVLLQRRPDLDSEAAAASIAAGRIAHYHRSAPESPTAPITAPREDSVALLATASHTLLDGAGAAELRNGGGGHGSFCLLPAQAGKANADSAASSLPAAERAAASNHALEALLPSQCPSAVLPSAAAHVCVAEEPRNEEDANNGISVPAARALPLPSGLLQPSANHRPAVPVSDSAALALPLQSKNTQPLPHHASLGHSCSYHDSLAGTEGAALTEPSSAPGKYLLLVKGADSSMMEIVNMQKRSNVRRKDKMLRELDVMAQQGLRTLVLGQRYLSEEEVREWLPIFHNAQCAMQGRSEKLHEAYALLEKSIDIVGTTAVEDKLQEEVPQTLEFIIQASIVVWMLTGDKRETAVTIAHTSGLVRDGYTDYVCHLDVSDIIEEEALMQQQKRYEEQRRLQAKNGGGGEASPPSESSPSSASDGGDPLRSPEASMETRAPQSASSGTRSPQPRSTRTLAGTPDSADEAQNLLACKCARIDTQLKAAEDKCDEGREAFGAHVVVVVVDGKTLDFIFEDRDRARRFFLLGNRCRSAVCCRMTPLQKAKVVRMFKRNTSAVVLAIGDGANDVSMIQESSIGVGIMGLEGSQAELASDYALPKFRFLKRLLFVHGRFSVFREAHCIIYSLYKNVILTVGMVAYQFYTGYSGQALIDSWLLAMFSIFFTSLQPLMIGILDKDVEDELAESLPTLYPPLSRELMYFSYPYIIKWLFDGLMQGLLFFFFVMYTVGVRDNLYTHMSATIEDYGATFFTMLVLIVDLRVGIMMTYYMIPFAIGVGLEVVLLPIIELAYSSLHSLAGSNWFVRVAIELYGASGKFWLLLFFACGVLLLFTVTSNVYIQLFAPWQNAGLAMRAARRSHHRIPYKHTKADLKAEYARLLARYEELLKVQQQQREEVAADKDGSGAKGKAVTQ
ncbi:hypothetical protein LSCM1_07612 [Leishmania martiniquensis]|uniref:P-type phospholipid transporter n=1 Tax=Leishmania martiniquensis TaxID=1580590 RepID=A0A836KSQ6_9TRYP|nr:hypothetical protein LSCM1_07612 [Leishmania martiniquensis]